MGKLHVAGFKICIFGILFLVPLVFWPGGEWLGGWPGFWLPFEIPKMIVFRVLLYLAVAGWLWKSFTDRRVSAPDVVRSWWFMGFAGAIVAVFLIATFFSVSFDMSFWGSSFRAQGLVAYLHYFLFFALLLVSFEREDFVRGLKVSGVALGIACVAGTLNRFGNLDTDLFLGRAFSTLGHPNYFASYILILFFPLMGLVVGRGSGRAWRWGGGGVLLLSMVALWLSGGRATMLGILVGLPVFLGLIGRMRKKGWLGVLVGMGLAGLVVMGGWWSGGARFEMDGENLRSVETRLAMWPTVVEMIGDRPVFGYGPDTFSLAYQPYTEPELLRLETFRTIFDRAHNVLLQWLVDFGVVGAGMFLASFVWLLVFAFRRMKGLARLEEAGVLSSLIGIFVAHQFGFSVTVHLVYLVFLIAFLLVGLSRGKIEFAVGCRPVLRGLVVSIWIGIVGALLLPNILRFSEHDGFVHLSAAKTHIDVGEFEAAGPELEAAADIMPLYPDVIFERGRFYYLQGEMSKAVESFELYISLAPEDWKLEEGAGNLEKYRLFHKANPGFGEAVKMLEEARK
jgi:O-antigen ligase